VAQNLVFGNAGGSPDQATGFRIEGAQVLILRTCNDDFFILNGCQRHAAPDSAGMLVIELNLPFGGERIGIQLVEPACQVAKVQVFILDDRAAPHPTLGLEAAGDLLLSRIDCQELIVECADIQVALVVDWSRGSSTA